MRGPKGQERGEMLLVRGQLRGLGSTHQGPGLLNSVYFGT